MTQEKKETKKVLPYGYVAYKLTGHEDWRVTSATDFDNNLAKREDIGETKRYEISRETGDMTALTAKKKTK